MLVNITKILDTEGKIPVNGVVNFGKVVFDGCEYDFSDITVNGEVVNIGGSLEFSAVAEGEYKTPCARCLKPVVISFDADIYEQLKGSEVNAELVKIEKGECELDEIILNEILINVPGVSLCSESCKGICPTCGKNLNKEECQCKEDNWDSRFDVLKSFKADL